MKALIIFSTLLFAAPAGAQTVEERLDTLEWYAHRMGLKLVEALKRR